VTFRTGHDRSQPNLLGQTQDTTRGQAEMEARASKAALINIVSSYKLSVLTKINELEMLTNH